MKRLPVSAVIVGLVIPAVVAVASSAVALTWLPDLPDSVAVHWGADGRPNGFDSPLAFILQLGVISVLMAGLFFGMAAGTAREGFGWRQKIILVLPLFLSSLFAAIVLVSLGMQRGLVTGADAPNALVALAIGAAAGAVGAVIGWFLLPRAGSPVVRAAEIPAPLGLAAGEQVLWTRYVTAPWPLFVVVGVAAAALVIAALLAPSAGPLSWALLFLVLLLVASALSWRVRVDGHGVLLRSILGAPRFRIRLADIDHASVPVVDPLTEFGGWGIRFGSGRRLGIILNRGDALEVHRVTGSSLVLTVDDAEEAASLINGLVARARMDPERR